MNYFSRVVFRKISRVGSSFHGYFLRFFHGLTWIFTGRNIQIFHGWDFFHGLIFCYFSIPSKSILNKDEWKSPPPPTPHFHTVKPRWILVRKKEKYNLRTVENQNHNRGEVNFRRKNEESPLEISKSPPTMIDRWRRKLVSKNPP